MYFALGCGNMTNADVVFALSPSASAEDTDKTLDFFRDVTEELNIGTDHIRVGMVPKDCRLVNPSSADVWVADEVTCRAKL